MTIPTPEPDPDIDVNDTTPAEIENPAEGGRDTHFTEEQAGLDPDVVSPVQDAGNLPKDEPLEDTDTGAHG